MDIYNRLIQDLKKEEYEKKEGGGASHAKLRDVSFPECFMML